MRQISSLSVAVGASVHVTAQVLDQNGQVITGLVPTITDTSVDSSFTPDAGDAGAGNVTGNQVGPDTLTATYLALSATLAVTVIPAPQVPTSIQFVSP